MINIYGIPNCDTIKKTLDWFKVKKVKIDFHDFKKDGVSDQQLKAWAKAGGLQNLLNKKSTTWRGLTPEEQDAASTLAGAVKLMAKKTSSIKRPVIEWPDGSITIGLDTDLFDEKLKAGKTK